jgi:hypothetical protein
MADSSSAFSPREIFLDLPLYGAIPIDPKQPRLVYLVEFFNDTIDSYCLKCARESVFRGVPEMPHLPPAAAARAARSGAELAAVDRRDAFFFSKGRIAESRELDSYAASARFFHVPFECIRDTEHKMAFCFSFYEGTLTKIGQFPSLADLQLGESKKYRTVLGQARFAEFQRAIGLASHGVGIGAYVYLRRLFESLIESAHAAAKHDPSWTEEDYVRSRIDEKILLLKDHLPTFLVQNRAMYSILSLGVHALSEEECLAHFEHLRVGIELILDEEMLRQERESKASRATKAIGDIVGRLKPRGK